MAPQFLVCTLKHPRGFEMCGDHNRVEHGGATTHIHDTKKKKVKDIWVSDEISERT